MRLRWLSMQNERALGPGWDGGVVRLDTSGRQDVRAPAPWMGSWLVLLLLVQVGSSSVFGAETPRLTRRPPPQAPASGPATSAVREPAPTGPVSGVTLQDNLLSVDIQEQDLRAVLETIATQGGIEVRHAERLPKTRVSVRFASLPVLDGLTRLFRAAHVTGYAVISDAAREEVKVRRILFVPVAETAGSVFDDIQNNTAAQWLLSQLVHPDEQVRERALERLVQLVGDDQKQAELLDTLELLLDNLSADDKTTRRDARAEIRKLLDR
jgi:hypothetical protein